MGEEQPVEFYDSNLERHVADLWMSDWLAVYSATAVRLKPDRALVDIGCGTGRFAKLLYLRGHRDYWGVDFSPARVAEARSYVPDFEFDVGDVFDPHIVGRFAEFDVFVALEILEHVERDRDLVASLPAGSRLVASVPNYDAAAHVRKFASPVEIIERYGDLLDLHEQDVTVLPRLVGGRCIFVFDGRRT